MCEIRLLPITFDDVSHCLGLQSAGSGERFCLDKGYDSAAVSELVETLCGYNLTYSFARRREACCERDVSRKTKALGSREETTMTQSISAHRCAIEKES